MSDVMRVTDTRPTPYPFEAGRFPQAPGCYLMRNAEGQIIYVGKAVNLRSRVASYFRNSSKPHRKAEMIRRIRQIDLFLVRNEREALVLESNLIRHHLPAYNSRFTHDEDSYYYIARTDETFPRFVPYRKRRTNFALQVAGEPTALFGPYVGWRLRNRILDEVRGRFALRRCHTLPEEACFLKDTGGCIAPCVGSISEESYARIAQRASRFLRRPPESVLRELREDMDEVSTQKEYEMACELRDRLRALEHAASPQVAERCRQGRIHVIYSDGTQAVQLTVADGVLVELEGLRRLPDFLQSTRGTSTIICNREAAEGKTEIEGRVRIPASGRSYAGQLLRIAELNFDFQTGRSIE